MPPRKPFRPDKNRAPGRSGRGSEASGARFAGGGSGGEREERRDSRGGNRTGFAGGRPGGKRFGKPGGKTFEGRVGGHPEEGARPKRGPRGDGSDRTFRSESTGRNNRSERNAAPQRGARREYGREESPQADAGGQTGPKLHGPKGSYWLFGYHAVVAAIDNPERRIRRLLQAEAGAGDRAVLGGADRNLPDWETVDRGILDRVAGREAVHQGIAAQVDLLPDVEIEDIVDLAGDRSEACVVILDQVTDPHNVGAILRSAAAFGALAVILTERNAAPETGTLAKAASGALEIVPLVRVTNLARGMEQLKAAGFWCVGLAAEAERSLAAAKLSGRVALCLGAEGPGLRRLTRAHCDLLAKLPTSGPIDHLNVSNAAAVALYELVRGR
jgi:23S rRNA (guanosine2251-2'-O)-methyltransferase